MGEKMIKLFAVMLFAGLMLAVCVAGVAVFGAICIDHAVAGNLTALLDAMDAAVFTFAGFVIGGDCVAHVLEVELQIRAAIWQSRVRRQRRLRALAGQSTAMSFGVYRDAAPAPAIDPFRDFRAAARAFGR
jgi:hypothetical protein